MDTFLSEAVVLAAVLVSVLLALWITTFALRGLFWLMTAISHPSPVPAVRPIRIAAGREQAYPKHNAA